jgi:hypothetical protein
MNIYESISCVMNGVGAITKGKKSAQGYQYRGVDDVMNALQPLLIDAKIFIVPEVIEHRREDRQSKGGGCLIYSVCTVKYTFYAEDGSNVAAVVVGEGMDSSDKSTNKAMSVAFKYACFQVFCIPTEEMADPDAQAHELAANKSDAAPKQNPPPKKDAPAVKGLPDEYRNRIKTAMNENLKDFDKESKKEILREVLEKIGAKTTAELSISQAEDVITLIKNYDLPF